LSRFRTGNPDNYMEGIVRNWPNWSWKNFEVADTQINKLSCMFCSYWNHDYGDHFSKKINYAPTSYNGPAQIDEDEVKTLLYKSPVREIVKNLKAECLRDETLKSFNHKNAWSFSDLTDLLEGHGFKCLTQNKKQILANCTPLVPDINFMGHWSMYILAEKK